MRYYNTEGDAVDLCPACASDRAVRLVHCVAPGTYDATEGREVYAENADAGTPSDCDACSRPLTSADA